MLSMDKKLFVSRVTQRRFIHESLPPDTVPIIFKLYELTGRASRWLGTLTEITYDGHILVGEKRARLRGLPSKSTGPEFKLGMAKNLSDLCVPDDEQAAIISKLGRFIKLAVPGVPVFVTIVNLTVRLYPIGLAMHLFRRVTITGGDCEVMIDRVTWESMETYGHQIAAAKSFIESLENLGLDSLDKETIRQFSQCAICWGQFDHMGTNVEEGIVTRLPCAHLYHRDCIRLWLERNHLCPNCRYQMPTMEASDPPWQLNYWPMLLMMATAMAFCRSLKRREG